MPEPTADQIEALCTTFERYLLPHQANAGELWDQAAWEADVVLFNGSMEEQGLAAFGPAEEDLAREAARFQKGVPDYLQPGWISPALDETFDLECLDGLVPFGPEGEDEHPIRCPPSSLGKVVVVSLWNDWCQPCHAAMPYLKTVRERYPTSELSLFLVERTVAGQPLEPSVRAYVRRNRSEGTMSPSDVYHEPSGRVTEDIWRRVGNLTVPMTYLFVDRVLVWCGGPRPTELGSELEKVLA